MSMFGISRTLFKGLSRGSNITQQCHMSIRGRIFIPPPPLIPYPLYFYRVIHFRGNMI